MIKEYLKGRRQAKVKSSLLAELESQFLKMQTILNFLKRKKTSYEQKASEMFPDDSDKASEWNGELEVGKVRNGLATAKAEFEKVIEPYKNTPKKELPMEKLIEVEAKQKEIKKMEDLIDGYEDVLDRIDKKEDEVAETLFHLQNIESSSEFWLDMVDRLVVDDALKLKEIVFGNAEEQSEDNDNGQHQE